MGLHFYLPLRFTIPSYKKNAIQMTNLAAAACRL